MTVAEEVLESFHRVLVEEIRAKRPEYLTGPFTVAEIYQDLVPYPTHRDRIGVEMNGDYEDALIRMLAGEGGYLDLDSEHALRELRSELQTSNPNTGVYREFAAVDVRLNPERIGGNGSALLAHPAATATTGAGAVESTGIGPEAGRGSEPSAESDRACRWCMAPLPARENLNFCPYCGTDVHSVPCSGCGNELEPEWRFCISCGTERPS
jgi:hypothetical protein